MQTEPFSVNVGRAKERSAYRAHAVAEALFPDVVSPPEDAKYGDKVKAWGIAESMLRAIDAPTSEGHRKQYASEDEALRDLAARLTPEQLAKLNEMSAG
jgi:predicted nuclease with RNAse H fold